MKISLVLAFLMAIMVVTIAATDDTPSRPVPREADGDDDDDYDDDDDDDDWDDDDDDDDNINEEL